MPAWVLVMLALLVALADLARAVGAGRFELRWALVLGAFYLAVAVRLIVIVRWW